MEFVLLQKSKRLHSARSALLQNKTLATSTPRGLRRRSEANALGCSFYRSLAHYGDLTVHRTAFPMHFIFFKQIKIKKRGGKRLWFFSILKRSQISIVMIVQDWKQRAGRSSGGG